MNWPWLPFDARTGTNRRRLIKIDQKEVRSRPGPAKQELPHSVGSLFYPLFHHFRNRDRLLTVADERSAERELSRSAIPQGPTTSVRGKRLPKGIKTIGRNDEQLLPFFAQSAVHPSLQPPPRARRRRPSSTVLSTSYDDFGGPAWTSHIRMHVSFLVFRSLSILPFAHMSTDPEG